MEDKHQWVKEVLSGKKIGVPPILAVPLLIFKESMKKKQI